MKNPVTTNSQRKLKVLTRHFQRIAKHVAVPELRLCGKWLNETGFSCGKVCTVSCEKNKITITVNEP
jgi:toxic protein SymE